MQSEDHEKIWQAVAKIFAGLEAIGITYSETPNFATDEIGRAIISHLSSKEGVHADVTKTTRCSPRIVETPAPHEVSIPILENVAAENGEISSMETQAPSENDWNFRRTQIPTQINLYC